MKHLFHFLPTAILTGFFLPATALAGDYYPANPGLAYAAPSAAALGPWRVNADIGGGPTTVVGNSRDQLKGGSNFTVGAGYNFTPREGLTLEFMNAGLGVSNATLQQNQALGGDAYIRSVTLNPIWRFRVAGPVGAYLIGGGGFYERETSLDVPAQVFIPTYHGGFYESGVSTVRSYDDTGGVNAGAGLTCNLGWGTKFFVEARYHYLFTSGKATQIIPITLGVRW